MTTLSYSVTEPALRSPVEEWQPHRKQSESTTEWWYLTAVVHGTAGNPYFLSRWTFVSCRMRRMLPTSIDGFKKHV
jgi:predicted secreted hydrolase